MSSASALDRALRHGTTRRDRERAQHPTELALDERFDEFHTNNPEVYVELVTLARELVERGHRKLGIGMLWEVIRWQRFLGDVGDDHYKLNNVYRSRYSRLIMAQELDLAGVFDTRELRT